MVGEGLTRLLKNRLEDRSCSKGGYFSKNREKGKGGGGFLEEAEEEGEGKDVFEGPFRSGVSLLWRRVLDDAKKKGRPYCQSKVSPRRIRELARSERFDKNDSFIIANSAASVDARVMRAFNFEFNHSVLREQTAVCL